MTTAAAPKTIDQFVTEQQISLKAEWADHNPHMDSDRGMDNWKVILRRPGARMQTYFSKGYGHRGAEPTADEVLDCLASDASTYQNASGFEDWAADLGYDTDSRTAERTYKAVVSQSKRLRAFLGDEAYEALLWSTERA